MIDYLKVGKATELTGADYRWYRAGEILPGALSWLTLLGLAAFSFWLPVWVAVFIILFDIYWLLLVIYLGIHLTIAFRRLQANLKVDYAALLAKLPARAFTIAGNDGQTYTKSFNWREVWHLVILPTHNEDYEVVSASLRALAVDPYPKDKMIIVLATEERGGARTTAVAQRVQQEFGSVFHNFLVTVHPDGIAGEIKGKGSNQAWAAKEARARIIDRLNLDYDKILVTVLDVDTVVRAGYFYNLVYHFFQAESPHRSSYQPIPVYNNNVWRAPFFSRVAAFSNTFWQMMLQIREEKLATYSSHSMTWRTLADIGFWSTKMVSEDSRIFFHAFFFYNGDYRVQPLYFPVSMDACMDKSIWRSARNLYKQQRRWGWGVENVPYLLFNTRKRWRTLPKRRSLYQIFVQIHGFHSWATNALIIGAIGWLPLLVGGDRFNTTVLSNNLPVISQTLMNLAMVGLLLSAIFSTLLLPKRPPKYGVLKRVQIFLEWIFLPVSIIIFGAIPGLEAQTRLMLGKYMGYWVTPKKR